MYCFVINFVFLFTIYSIVLEVLVRKRNGIAYVEVKDVHGRGKAECSAREY